MIIQPIHSQTKNTELTQAHILLINGLIRAFFPENTFNIYLTPLDPEDKSDLYICELCGLTVEDVTSEDLRLHRGYFQHWDVLLSNLEGTLMEIKDIDADDHGYIGIEFIPRPL